MDGLIFTVGERKYVRLFVYSFRNEPFYVRVAEYVLINPAGKVESSGSCDLIAVENGTNIMVLVEPQMEGLYTLKIQYDIGEEHLKKTSRLR